MKLYCEKVTYNPKKEESEVILDFNSELDMDKLSEKFGVLKEGENQSIIILQSVKFEKGTGFRSGNWYDIPIRVFDQFEYVEKKRNKRIFLTLKQNNKPLNPKQFRTTFLYYEYNSDYLKKTSDDITRLLEQKELKLVERNDLKLIVRDVGCGNWNEIKSPRFWLIYDLGGDIKFTDYEMECIFKRIEFNQKFVAFLSHWDLDHYRAILDLEESKLKLMKHIIVPSKIPNGVQVQKTFKRLQQLGIRITIVCPTAKNGSRITLKLIESEGNLKLYRSCDGSSMNMSGIVLVIEGKNKVCILTGDHHYSQLNRDVFPSLPDKPYELVVPHHGGFAGKFNTTFLDRVVSLSGAISTQSNRYKNLPLKSTHDYFKGKGFCCTECDDQDYIAQL